MPVEEWTGEGGNACYNSIHKSAQNLTMVDMFTHVNKEMTIFGSLG